MDQQLTQIETRLKDQEEKIAKIYKSVEQTRKIILWTGIITAALIILPAIGLVFAIPSFIHQFSEIQTLTQ